MPPALRPSPLLKICGLRQVDQAAAVARLGVDAVGVIGVPGSPRWLEPSRRPELFAAVGLARPACARVLVVADPGEGDLTDLEPARGGHTVLQLHGSETPERCLHLRQRLGPDLALWKALRIRCREDLEQVTSYGPVVDALLLDAWVPGVLGGTGQCLPVDWLVAFRPTLPWWLAGGVTPERVDSLLQQLQPDGLDASSGVEVSPGIKDMERVQRLVRAVRAHRRDPAQ